MAARLATISPGNTLKKPMKAHKVGSYLWGRKQGPSWSVILVPGPLAKTFPCSSPVVQVWAKYSLFSHLVKLEQLEVLEAGDPRVQNSDLGFLSS